MSDFPEKHSVLVVEDEPLVRIFLAEELRCAGLEVVEARTADEAKEQLQLRNFKAVVTDVMMPGTIDGFELALEVLQSCPETAVLIASGEDVGSKLPDGVHFESKPFNVPKLVRRVKAMVDA